MRVTLLLALLRRTDPATFRRLGSNQEGRGRVWRRGGGFAAIVVVAVAVHWQAAFHWEAVWEWTYHVLNLH